MEQFATDRNLLFGILALQMDFISRDALISAINAWALQKHKPLGQVLEEQGALAPADRALLEPLVQRHIEQHGKDPSQSLASLSSVDWIRASLEPVGQLHPEIVPSIQRLGSPQSTAPAEPRAKAADSETTAPAGSRFRILRFHARGGLGEVFVASDDELHREVALKQIQDRHSGHLDGRIRFVREAEITGGLEHPGIVPVYGLGHYDDGRPFYAMRFIKGDSLRQAIDQFHSRAISGLDPGARMLELQKLLRRFLDVCNAIAYAHSRGVLHRDIKPGNIMVGPYGETLVVDWGLAKVVGTSESSAEATLRPPSASGSSETLPGSPIGTPPFMSPEQAAGSIDQLGPASDVYSLGATLYCLLTGKAPIEGFDVEEVLRRVQQGEIQPPRQVKPDVPRALEAICLKAMALKLKDRYPAPRALAEDIERWLADEPVSAWREPYSIRARRWMRRNRTLVTTAAATVLVGLFALGVAYWRESAFNIRLSDAYRQLDDANRQVIAKNEQLETTNAKLVEANDRVTRAKVESDHRLDQTLHAIEDYYTGVSEEVLLNQKEFQVLRTRLLEKPRQFYEKLAAELESVSPQDVRAQTLLARGRSNLGRILQISGRHDEARKQFEAAKELYTILERAQPGNPDHLKGLSSSSGNLSIVLAFTGQTQAASDVAQKAIDIASKLVKDYPEDPTLQSELARHYQILSHAQFLLGKSDRSIGLLREAIVIRTRLTAAAPDNLEYMGLLARTHSMLGQRLRNTGDLGSAGKSFGQSIDILTRLIAAHPDRRNDRISMASTYNDLGNVVLDQGNLNGAIEIFQKAIAIGEKLAAEHPNYLDCSYQAALGYDNLCRALLLRRDNPGARDAARAALAIWSKLTTEDPTATEYQRGLADQYSRLGLALLQIRGWTESKEAFQKSIDLLTKLAAAHPDVPDYQSRLAGSWGNLGLLAAQTRDYQSAADGFQRACQIHEKLVSAHPNLVEYRTSLGIGTHLLGKTQISLGQWEKAIVTLRRAIEHQQAALSRAPLNASVKRRLSLAYLDLGGSLATLGRVAEVIETIRKRRALGVENSIDIYNDACQIARCVPIERDTPAKEAVAAEAVTTLRAAIAAGWSNAQHTNRDPDLAPLRDRDDFRRLVAELFDRSFPANPFAR